MSAMQTGRRIPADLPEAAVIDEAGMRVEVLYVEGCPGFACAFELVRRLAADAELTLRAIETVEQAVAQRFLGSPTVRVAGRDIDPGALRRTDYGLKCRLYPTADGPVHAPPEAWLRAALARPVRSGR